MQPNPHLTKFIFIILGGCVQEVAPPVDEIEGATASKPQGRPKKGINMDYVCELLFELHMPLTKVAAMCGVDRHTLYRRLKDEGT